MVNTHTYVHMLNSYKHRKNVLSDRKTNNFYYIAIITFINGFVYSILGSYQDKNAKSSKILHTGLLKGISASYRATNQYVSAFFMLILKLLNSSTMPRRSSLCMAIIYTLWHVAALLDELLCISFDITRDWTTAHTTFWFYLTCLDVSCVLSPGSHVWETLTSVLAEPGERSRMYPVASLMPSLWLLEMFIKKCWCCQHSALSLSLSISLSHTHAHKDINAKIPH